MNNESKNVEDVRKKNNLLLNKASQNHSAVHLKAMISLYLIIKRRIAPNNSKFNGKSLEKSLLMEGLCVRVSSLCYYDDTVENSIEDRLQFSFKVQNNNRSNKYVTWNARTNESQSNCKT